MMMNPGVRSRALLALLMLSVACGADPRLPTAPTPSAFTPPPPVFPPDARVYVFVDSPYRVSDYTRASRFVLYEDGTFALQYPSSQYRGTYQEANRVITFEWEGWSAAGPWGASGSLSDDSLTVQYNVIMQLTDFEDAVYKRTQ